MARRLGKDASYVSRLLYPPGKAGKKRIGDDMVDVIEQAFMMPRGWLSTPADEATTVTTIPNQKAVGDWPFRFERKRFDQLPPDRQQRIGDFALGIITEWEAARRKEQA